MNTEGRVQRVIAAVSAPFDSRDDWMILRALAELLGVSLPCDGDTLDGVRVRLSEVAQRFSTFFLRFVAQ